MCAFLPRVSLPVSAWTEYVCENLLLNQELGICLEMRELGNQTVLPAEINVATPCGFGEALSH